MGSEQASWEDVLEDCESLGITAENGVQSISATEDSKKPHRMGYCFSDGALILFVPIGDLCADLHFSSSSS